MKARDELLSRERESLLGVALEDLRQDAEVSGVYLAGSLAKGNHDLYSDIDLHIVVAPGLLGRFVECKRERAARWGPVLFYEDDNPELPVTVVTYETFVKVDAWYHQPDDIQTSLWLCGCRTLYDPTGIIQPIIDDSEKLVYQVTQDEVELWRGKVFAYMHETYRSVMRGELFAASSMLDSLRWQMARGWHMELGKRMDCGKGVRSKVEGSRSPLSQSQGALLRSWYCHLDKDGITRVLRDLAPEFLKLNRSLCSITGTDEKREWCQRIINKVL